MSPPTCVTDVGEIRIIHRIHSENLDSRSSDSQTGHFRIIHTITTERVGADPHTEQPCKITHSVATAGTGAQSSPMTCDLNEFKIEHILTVNPLPPEIVGRVDETGESSTAIEEDVLLDAENERKYEVENVEEDDSVEVQIMDTAEPETIRDCVEDEAENTEDAKEANQDKDEQKNDPPKQPKDSQAVEKNVDEDSSGLHEDSIKVEQPQQQESQQQEPPQQEPPQQEPPQREPPQQEPPQQEPLQQEPPQQEPQHQEPQHQEPQHQEPQHQDPQHQEPQPEERNIPSAEHSNDKESADGMNLEAEQDLGNAFMDNVVVKTEPEEASDLESDGMDFDFPRVTFPSFNEAYRPRPGCSATVTSETIGHAAEDSSENTPPLFPLYSSAIFPIRQSDRFTRSADGFPAEGQSSSTATREAPAALGVPPSSDGRLSAKDVLGPSLKPESSERQSCAMQAGATSSLPQQERSESENGQTMLADIVIKQEIDPDATSPCTLTRGNHGGAHFWPETMSSSQQDGPASSGVMPGSVHRQHLGLNSHRHRDDAIPSTSRGSANKILMQDIYNQLAGGRPLLPAADDDTVPLYSQVLSAPTFSLNDIMNHRAGSLFRQRNLPPDCECGARFRSIQDFNLHQCRATFDRRYSCPVCYKRWSMLDHLNQHMKIHTGQRPHVCNVCGKAFRQSGHLTRHAVIHSGAKPYRCPICGRGFNVSGNCQRHMRIHAAVSNVRQEYECCVCRQVFPTSTDRWYHMRTHMQ